MKHEDPCDGPTTQGRDEGIPPLLLLVHGTGPQAHDSDEVAFQTSPLAVEFDPGVSDIGDRWWQTESDFFRWLADRIRTRDGRRLDDPEMAFRFKWSGANRESERQAAAADLTGVVSWIFPRRVHVIAHSHGGNVVRSAIETKVRDGEDLAGFGAVISFGTPFFTHSRGRVFRMGLAGLALGMLFAATGFGAFELYRSPELLGSGAAWRLALVPVIAFCGLMGVFLAGGGWELVRRPNRGGPLGRQVKWTNFCSEYDEAAQLLRSFERPLPVLQRIRPGARSGLVWLGLVFAMGVTVAVLVFGAVGEWTGASNLRQFAVSVAWVGLVALLYQIMRAMRDLLSTGTSRILDSLLSARLRSIAYGDDDSGGLAGISTVPWDDHPEAYVPVGEAIEAAMDRHISSATAGLWGRMRGAMRPGGSLIQADIPYLVEQVLTGDELAHTCYYRIPEFVELVAERLVATGDYIWAPGSKEP